MSEHDQQISKTAWRTMAVLVFVSIFSYIDRQIIALMVEPIRASLDITDFQIGLVQGLGFGLFFALFGLPMGWLVDRASRRNIIYVGMTFWSAATAACGLAQNFWHLLIARFGVGIGEASLFPSAYSMIADLFPPRRLALALGIFATSSTIGSAIAYAVGGWVIQWLGSFGQLSLPLIGTVEPWQAVFMLVGAPGVLVALLLFTIPEPKRIIKANESANPPSIKDTAKFCRNGWQYLALHFTAFGCVTILAYGTSAWLPAMLMRSYNVEVANVGFMLAGITITSGVAGFLFSGWFVDRWFAKGVTDAHLRYFLFTSLAGIVIAYIAFELSSSLWITLGGYTILMFILPFTGPAVAHLQLTTPNRYRGQISAMFVLVFNLMGMCIGPPLVGILTDTVFEDPMKLNSSLALMYCSVALFAALLFWLSLKPARRAIALQMELSKT